MNEPVIKDANLEGLVCVQLDVHLWSGRKKLSKDDLIAQNPALVDLPPESLASMGSVKIADPDDLKPFMQIKRQAELLIRSAGLPMLGTTAIPRAKLQNVFDELSKAKLKFETYRKNLERDYDIRVDEWRTKAENREWSHLIKSIPTAEYVAGRMTFGMHFSRVSAPSDDLPEINKGFNQQLTGLKGELFGDAEIEAKKLLSSLMGKDESGVVRKREKITPKTLGPMRRIAAKFRSFSFLDPSVEPLAEMIEHVLAFTPDDGHITGAQLINIWSLGRTLSDSGKAMEAAKIAMTADTPSMAFEAVLNSSGQASYMPEVEVQPQVVKTDTFELAAEFAGADLSAKNRVEDGFLQDDVISHEVESDIFAAIF